MSASFMCWEPVLAIERSSPQFIEQLQAAQAAKAPPTETMLAFVAQLTARYPDLTETDDTPWATGPLTGEISGPFIHFVVSWSWYNHEVISFIATTSVSLGLQCFDAQSGIVYKPTAQ